MDAFMVFLFKKKKKIGAKMALSMLYTDLRSGDNWTPWGRETQNSISILHRFWFIRWEVAAAGAKKFDKRKTDVVNC